MKRLLAALFALAATSALAQNPTSSYLPECTDPLPRNCPSEGYSCWSTAVGKLNVIARCEIGAVGDDGPWTFHAQESVTAPVTSVFGRTGVVVATSGDYSHSLLSGVGASDHHTAATECASASCNLHTDTQIAGTDICRSDGTDCQTVYYQTVEDEDSALTQRATLNFAGAGVSCADDTDQTTCTISGGGGGSGATDGTTVWTYDTTATGGSGPGTGDFLLNSTTWASITTLEIHQTNTGGVDVGSILDDLTDNDYLYLQVAADTSQAGLYYLTDVTDSGAYYTLTVVHVGNAGGAVIANNDDVILRFVPDVVTASAVPTISMDDSEGTVADVADCEIFGNLTNQTHATLDMDFTIRCMQGGSMVNVLDWDASAGTVSFPSASIDPSVLTKERRTLSWDAGGINATGNCSDPTEVELYGTGGPNTDTIICTDSATSYLEGKQKMVEGWDGLNTMVFSVTAVNDNATPSGTHIVQFQAMCVTPGTDTGGTTWGTAQSATITFATQWRPETAVTSAITPNGSACSAGDLIHWRGLVNTGTTTQEADIHHLDVSLEYDTTIGD